MGVHRLKLGISNHYHKIKLVFCKVILILNPQKETEQNQLRLYRKYHNLIEKMERFSKEKQTVVNNLVDNLEKL